MMFQTNAPIFLFLAAGLLPLSGCNPLSAATFAYREVKGATAKFEPVDEISPQVLASYQSFRFEPATSSVGSRICPARLLQKYDEHAQATIEKYKANFRRQ